jgi:type IV pilus assembly protein PilA
MSSSVRPLGRKGFTLVELLIVVAIIGILSTVGVPTFRRMIQKSKKSEAQVNLGGVYTSEQAFLSEYGTYGNNLAAMGFQVDGQAATMTYVVGFYDDGCTPVVVGSTGTIYPTAGGGSGAAINAAFPNYYVVANQNVPPLSAFGPYNGNAASGYTLTAKCLTSDGLPTAPTSHTWGNTNSTNSGVTTDQNTFIAMASGVIAPGINRSSPGAAGDVDIWSIDESRNLVNNIDGVH